MAIDFSAARRAQNDDESPIGKGWVQGVMPLPHKVVDESGQTVFNGADITRGLMQYGSVNGHGGYLGPDYTADYPRRSVDFTAGEFAAAGDPEVLDRAVGELRQAADTSSRSPASLQLRYLQTLLELGADQNSTVVFPLPVDIITPFLRSALGPPGGEQQAP